MAKKRPAKKVDAAGGGGGVGALRLEWRTGASLQSAGHPRNWRRHPESQRRAWRALRSEVGYCGCVLLNEQTGHVLDGHMRVSEAGASERLPTLVGRWSECRSC